MTTRPNSQKFRRFLIIATTDCLQFRRILPELRVYNSANLLALSRVFCNNLWVMASKTPLTILILLIISVTLLTVGAAVHDPSDTHAEWLLTKTELSTHLRFLASDELGGRVTGTAGNDTAARYIAEQFRAFGLKSPEGVEDYLQKVPMKRVSPPTEVSIALFGTSLEVGSNALLLSGSNAKIDAAAVDAGYGLDEPQKEGDSVVPDLEGKVAVVKFGSPDDAQGFRAIRQKTRLLTQRGAVAIVELYSGGQWGMFQRFLGRERVALDDADSPSDSGGEGIPHFLAMDNEGNLSSELAAGKHLTAVIDVAPNKEERFQSQNVIGLIEGSDPDLKGEWIILSAHFDHVAGGPRSGNSDEDHIYNGARDNGMGTVALIAAAKTLAQNRPARSIALAAWTGEEMGLLGSRYYAEHPVIPLKSTVFNLNSDGAGYEDTSIATVLGLDRTSAAADIKAACEQVGLTAVGGGPEIQQLFRQSDNVAFAQKGVPAPTFSPGFHSLGEKMRQYYHTPADEVDENFDFDYFLKYTRAFIIAARKIADGPNRPAWTPGDEFEDAGKKLYGTE